MKKSWLILSWVGATALVSFITFQGLSAAQGGVNDSPLTPVVVATTVVAASDVPTSVVEPPRGSTTTLIEVTPSTSFSSDPTETQSQPTGSGVGTGSTTTTTIDDSAGTTSTTITATTSTTVGTTTSTTTAPTTTTTVAQWTTTTVTSPGGSVTVSYRPGEVRYEAAAPAAGYVMDIKETSPEVRVEFESDNNDLPDYEIRARWSNGALDSEVNQKG